MYNDLIFLIVQSLKAKPSSIFCFCHFRLKSLMDWFTLSWAVSLRLKGGWNMGWCQRKRNLCSFSAKSTRSVERDKLSLFMEKSAPSEQVESHILPVSVVRWIRVDYFDFLFVYFEGVDGCLAGSGSKSTEYSMSGWGDFSLLPSRFDNHHKVLDQCHQNTLWRSKCDCVMS